jgi:hypothetical protein
VRPLPLVNGWTRSRQSPLTHTTTSEQRGFSLSQVTEDPAVKPNLYPTVHTGRTLPFGFLHWGACVKLPFTTAPPD